MTELTDAELMAFADVMIWKANHMLEFTELPTDRDKLTAVIQLVVVDTWLMATDAVPLERWLTPEEGDRLAV